MNKLFEKTKNFDLFYYVFLGVFSIGSLLIWRYIDVRLSIDSLINIDDVASIQFAMSGQNFIEMLSEIIKSDPTNVPLFYILLRIWIKTFGYNPSAMRFLPELISVFSIFFVGLIGKKIKNRKLGIIAAGITATSIQIMYASFQIRAYSLIILGGAIVFYAWLCRTEKFCSQIFYIFALWLLSFTHFFGVLFCFALGLWDLLKVICGKSKFVSLIPYVVFCVVFVPYLLISFISANNMYGSFWPPVPDYLDIIEMIEQLVPIRTIGFVIFWGMLLFLLFSLKKNSNIKSTSETMESIGIAYWCIFIVVLISFVYSRYINPISSVWVYRYFLVLYPCMVIIVAFGISQIADWIVKKANENKEVVGIAMVTFLLVLNYQNVQYALSNPAEINTGGKEYKAIADYLSAQEDINSKTTLVYFPYPDRYFDGWIEFYTKGDKDNYSNMCCTTEELTQLDLSQFDTIYTIGIIYDVAANGQEYIDEKFDLVESNCNGINFLNRYTRR